MTRTSLFFILLTFILSVSANLYPIANFKDSDEALKLWEKCSQRSKDIGGPPLFAETVDLDPIQENKFGELESALWNITIDIGREGWHQALLLQKNVAHWHLFRECIPYWRTLRRDDFLTGLEHLTYAMELVYTYRNRKEHSSSALIDEYLRTFLALVGFFNEIHGNEVIPDWLLHWPGKMVGVLLGYLSHDIVKPQGCAVQQSTVNPE